MSNQDMQTLEKVMRKHAAVLLIVLATNSLAMNSQTFAGSQDNMACISDTNTCTSAAGTHKLTQNILSPSERRARAQAATQSGECDKGKEDDGKACGCMDGVCAGTCYMGKCDPDR
jgi:hypothetical protein